jgi:hypothetical protein
VRFLADKGVDFASLRGFENRVTSRFTFARRVFTAFRTVKSSRRPLRRVESSSPSILISEKSRRLRKDAP